jgi:pimeloyl-ACP methyl ester carboxylesterase
MKRQLATLRADVSAPERIKFTAPLVLVHGLWSGSWIWQEVGGALSQRGWEVWALDLRGRPGSQPVEAIGRIRLEDYSEDVVTAAQALWAPPVVCGHDLGALLALLTASRLNPRALVLLSPLLPRAWVTDGRPPLPLAHLTVVPALLWGRPLHPPRLTVASDFLFTALPQSVHAHLHARLQPDSGTVVRTLTREQLPFPLDKVSCPVLVVSGSADRMSPPMTSRWLADRLRAEHREYPGQGHWLLAGEQWTKLTGDLHRWLILTLGESLLVPPEEEEEER